MRKINNYNDPEFKVVLFSSNNEVISTSIGATTFGINNGFDVPNQITPESKEEFAAATLFF